MRIKRILIGLPLVLAAVLLQSFFWVPTYENQATGNPDRLVRYIQSTIGDAQILNPILSADSASSAINGHVFDGLLDLDDQLNYRPRLAVGWTLYEEAYLTLDPANALFAGNNKGRLVERDWRAWLRSVAGADAAWANNIRSVERVPAGEVRGEVKIPVKDATGKPVLENGKPKLEVVRYTLSQPPRLKITLERIDQDFFHPLRGLVGARYAQDFPFARHVRAEDPARQTALEPHYGEILQVEEHNPVIEFDLRRGVRFHDGHEFDADDVLFTYRAIMEPLNASPRMSDYEPVKTGEILAKYKIRFVYKRLFSPAINSWMIGMLPEHRLNREALAREARERGLVGDKAKNFSVRDSAFNRRPLGTGAFRFVEWQADEMIRLTRNDRYWETPPEYREFVMRIIPDSLTQEMEFYSGAVDNYSVQPHQVARFKKDAKYQSFSSVGYAYSYIGYNQRNPLFASAEVRRALGMAVDVGKIIDHVLYGEGERVSGPYPKITDWYDPAVPVLPYDPEGALKILNGLGWEKNADGFLQKDGRVFEFNLITNSGNPIRKNILTIAQNSWRKIGIKCNTQVFEWAVFLKDFVNVGKFDALVLGWSMGIDPDVFQIWHSSQSGPHQLNHVGYRNAEADDLIVRIRQEYDRGKQVELAHRLHRRIAEDQPYTFLFVSKTTQVLDKKIVIVERGAGGEETFKKIYPTRDGRINYYFNRWRKAQRPPELTG
jgi:ABC-type transport system substrate-binding protein